MAFYAQGTSGMLMPSDKLNALADVNLPTLSLFSIEDCLYASPRNGVTAATTAGATVSVYDLRDSNECHMSARDALTFHPR